MTETHALVAEKLKRQGFYTTHRWLRNQGFSLMDALVLLRYPIRPFAQPPERINAN